MNKLISISLALVLLGAGCNDDMRMVRPINSEQLGIKACTDKGGVPVFEHVSAWTAPHFSDCKFNQ